MGAKLDFIDVSHYRGTILWQAIADLGIKGAISKAGDGYYMPPYGDGKADHIDPTFNANWFGSNLLQLRGAFWYLRFDFLGTARPNIEKQMEMFNSFVPENTRRDTDVYVLDVEQPAGQIAKISLSDRESMLIDALTLAKEYFGNRLWIYTGAWWWGREKDITKAVWEYQMPRRISPVITQYPVWCANYPGTLQADNSLKDRPWPYKPYVPDVPNGWNEAIAWQYSDRGYVNGNRTDVNDFLGDLDVYSPIQSSDEPGEPGDDIGTPNTRVLELAQEISLKAKEIEELVS